MNEIIPIYGTKSKEQYWRMEAATEGRDEGNDKIVQEPWGYILNTQLLRLEKMLYWGVVCDKIP